MMLTAEPVFTTAASGAGIEANTVLRGVPWNNENLPNGTKVKQFSAHELGAAARDWVGAGSNANEYTPLLDVRGYTHFHACLFSHAYTATSLACLIECKFLAPMPVRDTAGGLTQFQQRQMSAYTMVSGAVPGVGAVTPHQAWANIDPTLGGPKTYPPWGLCIRLGFYNAVAVTVYSYWLTVFAYTNLPYDG